MTGHDDDKLEPFFDAARRDGPGPDFLARLQADADAQLPKTPVIALPRRRAATLWTGGGLLAAGVTGLAIGLSVPEMLNGIFITDGVDELASYLPAADPSGIFGGGL